MAFPLVLVQPLDCRIVGGPGCTLCTIPITASFLLSFERRDFLESSPITDRLF